MKKYCQRCENDKRTHVLLIGLSDDELVECFKQYDSDEYWIYPDAKLDMKVYSQVDLSFIKQVDSDYVDPNPCDHLVPQDRILYITEVKLRFQKHPTAIVETQHIGEGTKIWAHAHICQDAIIGKNCVIGECVYIGPNVMIGDGCKIQNGAQLFSGVTLGDGVFIGPGVVTTNDIFPDLSEADWKHRFRKTHIGDGAAIGANATIICGITIGANSLIGAGSVVTRDVYRDAIVYGNPSKFKRKK